MPRGSRIVDIDGIVHDVARFVTAYSGEAKEIGGGWVSENGTIRQFWPPTTVLGDALVLSPETEESRATRGVGETPPSAICNFDCRTGLVWLGGALGDQHFTQAIGPAPRETGMFLWKLQVVTGNVLADSVDNPIDVWIDMMSQGTLGIKQYALTNTQGVLSTETGQATISVALDDGAGAPLAGSQLDKTINFIAEITGSNLVLTTVPWVLSTTRVNEYAQSKLVVTPRIYVTGDLGGYVSGYEGGTQTELEQYAITWNTSFTAQVDIVSGTVNGSATGVALPINQNLSWDVEAVNVGDSQAAEVNLTISDGIDSVTKAVTLYAENIEEAASSSVSTDFTQYDDIRDTYEDYESKWPLFELTRATITFQNDGFVQAAAEHVIGQYPNFPQKWNVLAGTMTDPENFEIKLEVVSGSTQPLGDPVGVFLNLSTSRSWYVQLLEDDIIFLEPNIDSVNVNITVQEVGRPETAETKNCLLAAIVRANFWPFGTPPP